MTMTWNQMRKRIDIRMSRLHPWEAKTTSMKTRMGNVNPELGEKGCVPLESPNRSINQPESRLPTASLDSSLEADATIEIGEMLGFQFDGRKEQPRGDA
ncbi:hypothetical protein L2E82_29418 [Cichorium intybus]|uniref:Uncharacterized protein n=1 Tax=Cichorium intybus TaxID=13427 RepID=A0ACB9CXL6_CICIN|nr:hypothetical protein L2E82_29418 [Cichorium intybus]